MKSYPFRWVGSDIDSMIKWHHLKNKLTGMQNRHFLFVSLSLISLFIISCVTACAPLHLPSITPTSLSTTDSPMKQETKWATPSAEPTSAWKINKNDLRGMEINLWQPWLGEQEPVLQSFIDEFNRTNEWGIIVKMRTIGGIDELAQEVQTAWGSSNLPDFVIAYAFQAQNWQKIKPLVIDWQPYVADIQWGIPASEQESFLPNIWQSSVVAGNRWGIPARRDGQVMFANRSWAEELGIFTLPDTPEMFRKEACAAAAASAKDPQTKLPLSGGWVLSQEYPTIYGWISAFQGDIVAKDDLTYRFSTTEVKRSFQYLRQLYDDGCIIQLKDMNPSDALAERKGLFVSASSQEIPEFQDAFKLNGNSDDWTIIPIPAVDGKARMAVYGMDYILLQSDPKRQLASWLFVKWMITAQNQKRWSEQTLSLPFHKEVLTQLKGNADLPIPFQEVLNQVENAQPEPALASWNTVRWMLSDASRQLFAWYFTADQIDNLLKLLDTTANTISK